MNRARGPIIDMPKKKVTRTLKNMQKCNAPELMRLETPTIMYT